MSTQKKLSTAVIVSAAVVGIVGVVVGLWGMQLPAPLTVNNEWRGMVGYIGIAILTGSCLGFVYRLNWRAH
ncbi:MAG: hypothetical protein I4O49_20250 [Janthinobacterium lividum]|nr:hypothetical protein [Janthinobacterium lividum]